MCITQMYYLCGYLEALLADNELLTGSLLLMDIEVEPLARIHLLKQRF